MVKEESDFFVDICISELDFGIIGEVVFGISNNFGFDRSKWNLGYISLGGKSKCKFIY